ncbi:uncharacterized protein LOC107361503 [Tetranychus urticae]|uniref:uncharacterized protein LOC107361503 n=1 Tax=Tetranychus urticae TaxID=32264 RepID=UPI00077BA0C6|nr:uncharacterized protein LOC107361503 [Tetranychus urticae]
MLSTRFSVNSAQRAYRESQASRLNWFNVNGISPDYYITIKLSRNPVSPTDRSTVRTTILALLNNSRSPRKKIKLVQRRRSKVLIFFNSESDLQTFVTDQAQVLRNWEYQTHLPTDSVIKFTIPKTFSSDQKLTLTELFVAQNNLTPDQTTKIIHLVTHQANSTTFLVQISQENREKLLNEDYWVHLFKYTVRSYDHLIIKLCENCWLFNHYYNNCARLPKCKLCSEPHDQNVCELNPQIQQLKCASCQPPYNNHQTADIICPLLIQNIRQVTKNLVKLQTPWLILPPQFPIEHGPLPS